MPAMTYQVLARRLRPATFDALVGQDHVVRALVHALDQQRLHHAYLFTGTRGVGKTTIARLFAKCLNCERGVSSRPCGQCGPCREIADGRFIDLIEVDAASRTRVDDTRELLDNVQYRPTRGRYKVYLIDEVHMLSPHSFNALLKTLEEPPEHVKFLLATTDPKKVPITVLSRCLQFQLRNLLPDRIRDYLIGVLKDESVPSEPAALLQIARAASGSMRDALSITDQAIAYGSGRITEADVTAMLGTVGLQDIEPLIDALIASNGAALLDACAELAARGADFPAVLASLLDAFHDAAVFQTVGSSDREPAVERLAGAFDPETVQLFYQIVLLSVRDLSLAPDPRCGFEMAMLRLLAFEPEPAPEQEPETGARAASKPRARRSSGSTAASAAPESPPSSPAPRSLASAPGAVDDWFDVVGALSLSGVARMIVEHSLPVSQDAERWVLCLDRSHDTLLGDGQVKQVARALSTLLGRDTRVEIVGGEPAGETPAARKVREHREQHDAAVASLQGDEHVRSLLDAFDGRLDLDSVAPLKTVSGGSS